MYTFYTEDEIRNIISKKEMCEVEMAEIKDGYETVSIKIGDNPYEEISPNEIADKITDGRKPYGVASEGGIFAFETKKEMEYHHN